MCALVTFAIVLLLLFQFVKVPFWFLCVGSFSTGIIHSWALCPGLSQRSPTIAVWLICLPGDNLESCAVTEFTVMPLFFLWVPIRSVCLYSNAYLVQSSNVNDGLLSSF